MFRNPALPDRPGFCFCDGSHQESHWTSLSRSMDRPAFIITIDTEGDNLWSRPSEITTRNSRYLQRFQGLCDQFRLRPTWLTNYEMAECPVFRDFAHDVLARDAGEIGMHLHAWHSPPLVPLTPDDYRFQPYLIEYPDDVLQNKVTYLSKLLEDTFQTSITSHRAGRWAMDSRYASALLDCGYDIDCSVTPHVSWRHMRGAPQGKGGSDYRDAPESPYVVASDCMMRPGESGLLEVPMTTRAVDRSLPAAAIANTLHAIPWRLSRRVGLSLFPEVRWLRPDGRNLASMVNLVQESARRCDAHVEFMLHSSELMPRGSPRFPNETAIAGLYRHLESLFETASATCRGMTLSEFGRHWMSHRHVENTVT